MVTIAVISMQYIFASKVFMKFAGYQQEDGKATASKVLNTQSEA